MEKNNIIFLKKYKKERCIRKNKNLRQKYIMNELEVAELCIEDLEMRFEGLMKKGKENKHDGKI